MSGQPRHVGDRATINGIGSASYGIRGFVSRANLEPLGKITARFGRHRAAVLADLGATKDVIGRLLPATDWRPATAGHLPPQRVDIAPQRNEFLSESVDPAAVGLRTGE